MKNIINFPDISVLEEEASQWIVKIEGDAPPSKQDIDELKEWMSRSDMHRDVLIRLASSWNDMDLLSELIIPIKQSPKPDISNLRKLLIIFLSPVFLLLALWVRLGRIMATATSRFAAVAMVLSVCVAFSSWFAFYREYPADRTYFTSVGEQSTYDLADGTTLWLNTNSKIEVDYTTEKRQILLHKGEAHFKVSHDPQRPFEVYAGMQRVTAVGTAFSVYLDSDNFRVTVIEGKVDLVAIKPRIAAATEVVDREKPKPLEKTPAMSQQLADREVTDVLGSLVAGQSVVIPTDHNSAMEEIITYEQQELSRRLSWLDGQLVFAGESLEEVVREVSRYTSLRIEVSDPVLKGMRIGGQFQVGETEALFDVLESSFGVKVSHLSDHYVLLHAEK